jgi:hypothetical protein
VAIIRSSNNTVGIPDSSDPTLFIVQAVDNFVGIYIGDENPSYPTSAADIENGPRNVRELTLNPLNAPEGQIQTRANRQTRSTVVDSALMISTKAMSAY